MMTLETLKAKKATLLGSYRTCKFYEHPTRGDEAPVIIVAADGVHTDTDAWDIESARDWVDANQSVAVAWKFKR